MMKERCVTVQDVLAARDDRAQRQAALLQRYHQPVISFTMNIAGPVKVDNSIRRAFEQGTLWINTHLAQLHVPVLHQEERIAFTGCEALWVVRADAASIKTQTVAIEESCPLGRLFDIDVIDANGEHLSREEERTCLICAGPVRACARSRQHSAEELFRKTHEVIDEHFQRQFVGQISQCAQRALLYEALTTPKPGLVDCANNGAHQDMDLFSFAGSASALGGYFEDCVRIGLQRKDLAQLQHVGMLAEKAMWIAAGANTHKGAIFSLGILCCAIGRCGEGASLEVVFAQAAEVGQYFLQKMNGTANAHTGGELQYQQYGITGARGEAASGFRSVREIALPALNAALARHLTLQDAGKEVLLHLMARVMDSNIIRRAGMDGQQWVMAQSERMLREGVTDDALRRLDAEMIRRNISPGGSADLLAAAYFLHFISQLGGVRA